MNSRFYRISNDEPNDPPSPTAGQADPIAGVPGQGNSPDPRSVFGPHFVVAIVRETSQVVTKVFDPSYGTGSLPNVKAWELASLFGIQHLSDPNDTGVLNGYFVDVLNPATTRITNDTRLSGDAFFPFPS